MKKSVSPHSPKVVTALPADANRRRALRVLAMVHELHKVRHLSVRVMVQDAVHGSQEAAQAHPSEDSSCPDAVFEATLLC
jgi:hypothetical protein